MLDTNLFFLCKLISLDIDVLIADDIHLSLVSVSEEYLLTIEESGLILQHRLSDRCKAFINRKAVNCRKLLHVTRSKLMTELRLM